MVSLLRDPHAPVWADHDAFLALLAAHGWEAGHLAVSHRSTHPQNRRAYAAEAWAVENRVTLPDYPHAVDRPALRRLRLAYDNHH